IGPSDREGGGATREKPSVNRSGEIAGRRSGAIAGRRADRNHTGHVQLPAATADSNGSPERTAAPTIASIRFTSVAFAPPRSASATGSAVACSRRSASDAAPLLPAIDSTVSIAFAYAAAPSDRAAFA